MRWFMFFVAALFMAAAVIAFDRIVADKVARLALLFMVGIFSGYFFRRW